MSYKGSKKQCPIKNPYYLRDCMKEKCAWYLVHSKQCAIPLMASTFQKFVEVLEKGVLK